MNINPVPFPLRFASPPQPVQDAGKAHWVPTVKGYSTQTPQTVESAAAGGSRAPAVGPGRTRGQTTQFGKITDPPRADMDIYG